MTQKAQAAPIPAVVKTCASCIHLTSRWSKQAGTVYRCTLSGNPCLSAQRACSLFEERTWFPKQRT